MIQLRLSAVVYLNRRQGLGISFEMGWRSAASNGGGVFAASVFFEEGGGKMWKYVFAVVCGIAVGWLGCLWYGAGDSAALAALKVKNEELAQQVVEAEARSEERRVALDAATEKIAQLQKENDEYIRVAAQTAYQKKKAEVQSMSDRQLLDAWNGFIAGVRGRNADRERDDINASE